MSAKISYPSKRFDEVFTPKWVAESFMDTMESLGLLEWVRRIWCPADTKDSNIVKTIYQYGYEPIATHIHDGKDFLDTMVGCDMIVTNPPYTIKNKFIERAFEIGKPFAFLLPLDAVTSKGRVEMYMQNDVGFLMYDKRIDFTGKRKPHFYNVWLLGNCGFDKRIHYIRAGAYT